MTDRSAHRALYRWLAGLALVLGGGCQLLSGIADVGFSGTTGANPTSGAGGGSGGAGGQAPCELLGAGFKGKLPLEFQTAGDCKSAECDGNGNMFTYPDDADLPKDGNDCTLDGCAQGVAYNEPLAIASPCSAGYCDGKGKCVQCVGDAECVDPQNPDNECRARLCKQGMCATLFAAKGKTSQLQQPGDCKKNVCDGNGAITQVPHDDPPDDGNSCTTQTCDTGKVVTLPKTCTNCCGKDNKLSCDNGVCGGCTSASQCGGDNQCRTATCEGGKCGFKYLAEGTAVSPQKAGDCQKLQCDGSGNEVAVADDSDVPNDGVDCTDDVCKGGAVLHPCTAINKTCDDFLGKFCDGLCKCVECNSKITCPKPSNECQTASCELNKCGTANVADGFPTSNQTSGDCKTQVCDGKGGKKQQENTADVPPDDGNQCTSETCQGSTPSHPPKPSGSTCTQDGGKVCDGSGKCVECNVDADCGGKKCSPTKKCVECNVDADCGSGKKCTANQCIAGQKGLGESCTAASECKSGYCVDGVCCEDACSAVCHRCNTGGGQCKPVSFYEKDPPGCTNQNCCLRGQCGKYMNKCAGGN